MFMTSVKSTVMYVVEVWTLENKKSTNIKGIIYWRCWNKTLLGTITNGHIKEGMHVNTYDVEANDVK